MAQAEPPTRREAVEIAASFAAHRWHPTAKNVRHGSDADGIEVHTPNQTGDEPGLWKPGHENVGIAYKWGGFDTLESFDRGVRAGKAAGDLYSAEKRRLGGKAVSSSAVGIDCSGFISRCWRLPTKHSTSSLPSVCEKLRSASELRAGDVMNQPAGHVLLFAKWLDDARTRGLFYEAHPFSKVIASERDVSEMTAEGYTPLRYRRIRE